MYTDAQVNKIIDGRLKKEGLDWSPSLIYVLAVRGNDGHNDMAVFDDRNWAVKDKTVKGVWQMNTDPSSDVPGRAHLLPGVYDYKAGDHKGRAAFVQAGPVRIHRFGQSDEEGYFGINLHDAPGGTTSSAGCQTWKQYGGVSDFFSTNQKGFRDVMYRMLGVSPHQCIGHKEGVGRAFKYILVTLAEAEQILGAG